MSSERDKKTFNPFPGLRPFAPEESDLFFGRKGESEEVIEKLIKNKFVTVMGASGTGKSSLIYCGVLPGIRNPGSGSAWKIISFRPGNDPFGNLALALSKDISAGKRNVFTSPSPDNPGGISGMIREYTQGRNEKVLLVIDQFEELFRYSSSGRENSLTARFVDSLVSTINEASVNVFTIITMRSDFIGECAHYQGLTQLINNSNYLVPHMGRENYREAIEGPVNFAGAQIDPALVEILLNDIGDKTDQLPVLQHAMMRTWSYWLELDEPTRPISKSDYDSVGTMSNAMSMHANEAYEELSARGKEVCESMFKIITDKGSDNKGLRRPTSVKTIMSIADCSSKDLFEVVDKFRVPSRSFITPRHNVELTEDSIIDISHESLMRLWDRLREWVEDESASVQMYLRLSDASAMYQQGKTSLWRPPDLQLAINWRDQHKPTLAWAQRYNPAFERAMVYLRTSEQEYLEEEENKIRLQKRQMRRTKIAAMILGTAALISMAFMLFAYVQKIAADRQTVLAEQRRIEADLERAKADTARIEADEQRKVAEANEDLATIREEEARKEKENADRQKVIAQRNEKLAKENETYANIQKDSATRAKELAIKNEQTAKKEREEAQRLRMLSIGKAMAIKSLQPQSDTNLQAILAYQAYLFNRRNSGLNNDADIYAGLYNVSKRTFASDCRTFKGHNGMISSIAYVPGKKEFYTSGTDGKVLKWNLEDKENSIQVIYSGINEKTGAMENIVVLAISPDAEWLACGSNKSTIRMIPLRQKSGEYVLSGHKGSINSLVYSYDGKYLYSAALDGKVLKWDLAARTSTDVTDGSMKIISIDVSSNGKYIAGISSDGKVMVWDPERKPDSFRIETTGRSIMTVRFNPQNNLLAIGDLSGRIELWDVSKKVKISETKAHDSRVTDIRFNPVLKQMATASTDKRMKIFNITTPEDLTEPPITLSDDEYVTVMQFSSDGQLIISGAYQGQDNLVCRPTHIDYFVNDICNILNRNMNQTEWNTYVGPDIPIEPTCEGKPMSIKVSAIK